MMPLLSLVYDVEFRGLALMRELIIGEHLSTTVDLVLADPPYGI